MNSSPSPTTADRRLRRDRGLLALALVALLPLAILAVTALVGGASAYRKVEEERLRDTARILATAVDARLNAAVAGLEALARSPLLNEPMDVEAFEQEARVAGEVLGGWIVLTGPPPENRRLAMTLRSQTIPRERQLPPETERALGPSINRVFEEGRPGVSDLFMGPIVGGLVVAVGVPVQRDGHPTRRLSLTFVPTTLQAMIRQQDLPEGTFVGLRDGSLRILAYSSTNSPPVGDQAPAWMAAAIEGRQRTLVTGTGANGREAIFAIERVPAAPEWTVVAGQSLVAQAAAARQVTGMLLLGATAVALALIVPIWASRRVSLSMARAEASALRAGRAEVEQLHGALPAIIFLRDIGPDGERRRLLYRGGDIEGVTGWPSTVVGNRELADWAEPGTDAIGAYRSTLATGAASLQWRLRHPDGHWQWMHSSVRLQQVLPDGGALVAGYIVNITAEREARARAETAGRLASLGEMALGLAHELKQPLQVVTFAAENAQADARRIAAGPEEGSSRLAAAIDTRLGRIIGQAMRAGEIIEHLRRFARGADIAEMRTGPVPVATAVEGALVLVGGSLRAAGIEVETDLGDPAPVVVAEAVALEQVLVNLLQNARDAMAGQPEETPRMLRISAHADDEAIRIFVADTGGGIPPALLPRVFEPFVTTKDVDKGTGLGLSICHGLVKAMGGAIEVRNDSHGALFTITLARAAIPVAAPA